jgi:Ran GTPase-activating protein (RanGAP) involved in mRNA processing and transport
VDELADPRALRRAGGRPGSDRLGSETSNPVWDEAGDVDELVEEVEVDEEEEDDEEDDDEEEEDEEASLER